MHFVIVTGNVVEIIRIGWMACGKKRIVTGVTDRARWEAGIKIGIIGGIDFEFGFGNGSPVLGDGRAAVTGIQNSGINLKGPTKIETSKKNAGNQLTRS